MKYVIITGVVILAIFLVVLIMIPKGIEPLTEVYFENHTSLPINVYLGKTYNFSFTIHNLEYQDMGYNYTVSKYNENETLMEEIGSGSFVLSNNQSKTITQEYRFNSSFDRSKIEILVKKDNLNITPEFKKRFWWSDPNYPTQIDIHFWVDEIVKTTINITKG
jgi:hypothetical protein